MRASLRNWSLIWLTVLAASVALSLPATDPDADDARQEQAIAYIADAQEAHAIYRRHGWRRSPRRGVGLPGRDIGIAAPGAAPDGAVSAGDLFGAAGMADRATASCAAVAAGARHRSAGRPAVNLAWAAAAATEAANPLAAPA